MSGLKELIESGKFEDQNTSSVPGDTDSIYSEPYDPSAAKGLGAIALAGAGAVALRTPIGRALNKIANLRKPKLPVSRIKEPVDEVEEVLTIAPTKIERGRAMTRPQITQQEQIRQEAIQKSNELKKLAYQQPLSRGGKTNRIGSSLFDYIARHPIAGARKASEWIRDFKSGGPGSFKTGNPDFKNINQAVKKEELWDSNLLQLNKQGEPVGGFLKIAEEKGIPLTKMDLLYIVEKAPVNNLKMRKLTTNIKLVDDAEDMGRQLNLGLQDIRNKAVAKAGNEADNVALSELVQDANATQKSIMKTNARITNQYRVAETSDFDDMSNVFSNDIQAYKNIATKAQRLGITVDMNEVNRLTDLAKAKDTELTRLFGLQKTQGFLPKYGSYNEYRIKGGDEYFENVVYYPKKLPMNQKLGDEYQKHYTSNYGSTKPIPNQVYHTRGSIRSGGSNENQKVMLIDEIQSDYHQKLRKVNPERDKVVNAFGNEIEFFSANRKLENIVNEMTAISRKGVAKTREDMDRFRKLSSDFDELKKNSMNLANIGKQQSGDGIPFLPLHGKENWGAHALKNQIKDAADRGIDWVAISPVENLHHAKRTQYLGDIEFYGTRTGKAGFKNYGPGQGVVRKDSNGNEIPAKTDPNKKATLPSVMEKLAKQYNSEVKTIPVAKSDPNKPFKVVTNVNVKKAFGLNPDRAGTEHVAAFRTAEEAQYYSGRYGGDVIEMQPGDSRLYFDAFAIKVTPDMATKPFKAYNTGGLVVNIFA
jgi:hypothetical protein